MMYSDMAIDLSPVEMVIMGYWTIDELIQHFEESLYEDIQSILRGNGERDT